MLTGKRIKERRLELGMSADDLAAILGKNRATIYRYEGDEIENFPVSIIEPLAKALLTTPEYLMGWTDSPFITEKRLVQRSEPKHEELIRLFESLPEEAQEQILGILRTLAEAHSDKKVHRDSVE